MDIVIQEVGIDDSGDVRVIIKQYSRTFNSWENALAFVGDITKIDANAVI